MPLLEYSKWSLYCTNFILEKFLIYFFYHKNIIEIVLHVNNIGNLMFRTSVHDC